MPDIQPSIFATDTFATQFFRAGSRHGCYRGGRAGGRAVNA
jgi:hypothetical protein